MLVALAPSVRACHAGDLLVLLDLSADRYTALPLKRACLEGAHAGVRRLRVTDAGLAQELAHRGVLATEGAGRGVETRYDDAQPIGPTLIAPAPLEALGAALWAERAVRRGALDRAFAQLERRKRALAFRSLKGSLDRECARFAAAKLWLPFAMLCLADSLALTRFLARRGFGAQCVIGVKVHPFIAHAWCEYEGAVLNDDAAACASFTPIARV